MNNLGLTPRELRDYLASGAIGYRKSEPKTNAPRDPEYYRKRRKALKERGLTSRGTKPMREWVSLKELTPEQRKIRIRMQKNASRIRRSK